MSILGRDLQRVIAQTLSEQSGLQFPPQWKIMGRMAVLILQEGSARIRIVAEGDVSHAPGQESDNLLFARQIDSAASLI